MDEKERQKRLAELRARRKPLAKQLARIDLEILALENMGSGKSWSLISDPDDFGPMWHEEG